MPAELRAAIDAGAQEAVTVLRAMLADPDVVPGVRLRAAAALLLAYGRVWLSAAPDAPPLIDGAALTIERALLLRGALADALDVSVVEVPRPTPPPDPAVRWPQEPAPDFRLPDGSVMSWAAWHTLRLRLLDRTCGELARGAVPGGLVGVFGDDGEPPPA